MPPRRRELTIELPVDSFPAGGIRDADNAIDARICRHREAATDRADEAGAAAVVGMLAEELDPAGHPPKPRLARRRPECRTGALEQRRLGFRFLRAQG